MHSFMDRLPMGPSWTEGSGFCTLTNRTSAMQLSGTKWTGLEEVKMLTYYCRGEE